MTKFFVWCAGPHGLVPSFEHPTYKEAEIEAERLARMNPGMEFYVLCSIGHCVKEEVRWYKNFQLESIVADTRPF